MLSDETMIWAGIRRKSRSCSKYLCKWGKGCPMWCDLSIMICYQNHSKMSQGPCNAPNLRMHHPNGSKITPKSHLMELLWKVGFYASCFVGGGCEADMGNIFGVLKNTSQIQKKKTSMKNCVLEVGKSTNGFSCIFHIPSMSSTLQKHVCIWHPTAKPQVDISQEFHPWFPKGRDPFHGKQSLMKQDTHTASIFMCYTSSRTAQFFQDRASIVYLSMMLVKISVELERASIERKAMGWKRWIIWNRINPPYLEFWLHLFERAGSPNSTLWQQK